MIKAKVDMSDYVRAMRVIDKHRLPATVAASLDDAAEAIRKHARRNVKNDLTVRTKYTINSIKVFNRPRGSDISRMYAKIGSMSDYLPIHDEGGIRKATEDKIPKPTNAARISGDYDRRLRRKARMDQLEKSGASVFLLKPKSPKGKLKMPAFFFRKNKREIVMLRALDKEFYRIAATNWFSTPVKKYGTPQYIQARFLAYAKQWLGQYK